MAELTPRDDDKKRVSEILKRVDQLIKSRDYEQASKEIEHARGIDPRNVYIEAYHERIVALIEQSKKDAIAAEAKRRAEAEELKKREEEKKKRDEQLRKEELERTQRQNEERKKKEEQQRLQQEEEDRQKQEEAKKQPPQKTRTSSKPPAKILIVDDDDKLLKLIQQTIEDEGFDVRAFTTSDEAYKVLKTETPDLILSDINLETSTMGGFTFFEKIRELDHLHEVPFIFLSGLSDEVLIRTGKELGVDDYLTKPFSDRHLLSTIKGKLKRYRQVKDRRKSS